MEDVVEGAVEVENEDAMDVENEDARDVQNVSEGLEVQKEDLLDVDNEDWLDVEHDNALEVEKEDSVYNEDVQHEDAEDDEVAVEVENEDEVEVESEEEVEVDSNDVAGMDDLSGDNTWMMKTVKKKPNSEWKKVTTYGEQKPIVWKKIRKAHREKGSAVSALGIYKTSCSSKQRGTTLRPGRGHVSFSSRSSLSVFIFNRA
ncbi:hypothetical protein LR48_Vigan03g057400 [Vigna angularis]|uniref:Uncharacterized protein n=1 Tax=Phaseolus angularis TaxID=3914 RepID=A0A0L9U2Y6_PHAAN|nr:hypothetical protein LR48_Vigan03g057400 [Vigna angularis]